MIGHVDLAVDHPVGRVPDASFRADARLTGDDAGWALSRPRRRTVKGGWDAVGPLLSGVDDVHALHLDVSGADAALAATLPRLAARGTLLHGTTPAALDPELRAEVPVQLPGTWAPGLLDWDTTGVRQRRAALRSGVAEPPSVTAVLVSKRPDDVRLVLEQLDRQTYPRLEVVVGLHGSFGDVAQRLGDGLANRPTVVELDESRIFGDVLNDAFAHASGDLVTKVDDDDVYGPDHVWDLVLPHLYADAQVVGKTTTVVHLEALDLTVRRVFGTPETFTHRVAGGTMLISAADLAAVGGWASVPRGVDTALLKAVHAAGGRTYRPHDLGYLYVRHDRGDAEGHTWHAGAAHFLQSSREQWLGRLRHTELGTA